MKHALTRFRERRGLTMEAFGRTVGVEKGTVSKWERHHARPRISSLVRIKEATGGEVTAMDFVPADALPDTVGSP